MTRPSFSLPRLLVLATACLGLLAACGGGSSLSVQEARSAGDFKVESANVSDGDVWALNRPILITFNHPVDFSSVGFGSIIIRPISPGAQGQPVTGEFQIQSGSGGKTVIFYPTCPTNPAGTNGAFLPGGFEYELSLPTVGNFGTTVVRDKANHPLVVGLTRTFFSPTPPGEPLFIDTVVGPPRVTKVTFPSGLNLFTRPDAVIEVQFDQPVNASAANLNQNNIFVLYSDDEIGTAGATTFASTNRVPGQLFLVDNCSLGGALVRFQLTGILPVNRNLKVVVAAGFSDLSGQTTSDPQESALFATPTLAALYNDPSISPTDETADEFSDFYATSNKLSLGAQLPLPRADVSVGRLTASFDFPGSQVGPEEDFVLAAFQGVEVQTDGTFSFSDSNGRDFVMHDGVLEVDDFTLQQGSTFRGRGSNPLVIYATGTVNIQGQLDVSGNHARTPIALNAPQIAEPGALGECGGGDGGTASQVLTAETTRGEGGTGAFGAGIGGGGGEGSVTFLDINGNYNDVLNTWISAGGAGGTYALTRNLAVYWDRWSGPALPATFDDAGPDLRDDIHGAFNDPNFDADAYFAGGEDGLRGNSWRNQNDPEPPNPMMPPIPYGGYGMEELAQDKGNDGSLSDIGNLEPVWASCPPPPDPCVPTFNFGHPTNGPDPGFTNPSIFGGGTTNDFWGLRYNGFTGAITTGELLAPWAGAGGGASGDSQIILRLDLDGDSFLEPMANFYPDPSFPFGSTIAYWKGAPGGGGGGQIQVMAVGPIILGASASLLANGGIGNSGESTWQTTSQVSGSGGGSGGHVVLHSATGLDLSAVDLGADPVNSPPDIAPLLQAIGGRRGSVASVLTPVLLPGGELDGNSDFMIGRGGAGGNGVIQVHVPDPATDIAWHPNSESAITDYIQWGNPGNPVDTDRLEEILEIISAPRPYALIPLFASKSMVQSAWVDTGLAELHLGNTNAYPDYTNALLAFAGTDTTDGSVQTTPSGFAQPGPDIAGGSTTGGSGASVSENEVVIPAASTRFVSSDLRDLFTREPGLLVGYDFLPDDSGASTFEVTSATYKKGSDTLTLTTLAADGNMLFAVNPSNPTWSLRQKFLRVSTTNTKDRLPPTANIMIEFQGADEAFAGANSPGTPTAWVYDPTFILGLRFFRYRVTFDMAASGVLTLSSERPSLEYVKIPFVW